MMYINQEYETNSYVLRERKSNLRNFINFTKGKRYGKIIVLSTGSSTNAVYCAKHYLQDILKLNLEIKMPSDFLNYENNMERDALYLAVTQGGRSYSTIEALKKAKSYGLNIVTLTSDLNSPVCEVNDVIVDIGCGVEKVGYVTKGFSATVLTLILMGLELAFENKLIDKGEYDRKIFEIEFCLDKINEIIDKSLKWYQTNKEKFLKSKKFVSIGHGPVYGVVRECETKFTETIRLPMNGYELEEYMHGPYLSLTKDDTIIFIEGNSKLEKRQELLRNYVTPYVGNVFNISSKKNFENSHDLYLDVECNESLIPILLVIPVQIVSYCLAEDLGNSLSKKIFEDFDEKLKGKV